jgi:hypothetical protein
MKRIGIKKAREMVEGHLIRELKHGNIEGTGAVNSSADCGRVIERVAQDLLQIGADYYRIGNYMNIMNPRRKDGWTHHISVFYYQGLIN